MSEAQQNLFEAEPKEDLGKISIRVHVLPPKKKKGESTDIKESVPQDADDSEDFLFDDRSDTPLGSYLESSKGGRCIVFVVNGQRQDFLDNGFIVRDLGFKYLRNRMMITIDVDGLEPYALGELMQASRQGFYKGDVWNALRKRIIATLKSDPDLLRLEQEAEARVAELEGGDERVKSALNQLIDAHHIHGLDLAAGLGQSGIDQGREMGEGDPAHGNVVSLFPPDQGQDAEPPVLLWRPSLSSVRLKPNETRTIILATDPPNAWQALAGCDLSLEDPRPEFAVSLSKKDESGEVSILFSEPEGFDTEHYPISAVLIATARFNGIAEPRQTRLKLNVRPDTPAPPPVLLDDPDKLMITSRQPVKLWRGESDVHIRLRWNGKDHLLSGRFATWRMSARILSEGTPAPKFAFSDPANGRFTLAIAPVAAWDPGATYEFEVEAHGPEGKRLSVRFSGEVLDRPEPPDPSAEEARLVEGRFKTGENRRPPYDLKFVWRPQYDELPCWAEESWTDADPACFYPPNERNPLILVINRDFGPLREFRDTLIEKRTSEQRIEERLTKYEMHVAFHLYQMYQASLDRPDENIDEADARRRQEIHRVAMTLLKLMSVAR